jgi:hypothetical protein
MTAPRNKLPTGIAIPSTSDGCETSFCLSSISSPSKYTTNGLLSNLETKTKHPIPDRKKPPNPIKKCQQKCQQTPFWKG